LQRDEKDSDEWAYMLSNMPGKLHLAYRPLQWRSDFSYHRRPRAIKYAASC